MNRVFSVSVLALGTMAVRSNAFTCSTYDSNMGATFDLTDLVRMPAQPAYIVEDGDVPCTTKIEQNYTYVYNICGAVSGGLPRACDSVPGVKTAGAVQIDKRGTETANDDFCYLVGEYNEANTRVELLDQNNPTKGLRMTYAGAFCRGGTQRTFNIELQCANRLNPVPTQALELSPCQYTITMPSVYGCPLECPVSNRALCGGQGHCAYDDDKGGARCFCNNGYTGADCSAKVDTSTTLNYSPALLGLIITLFVIICVLIASVLYMVRQISAYKEDMANYKSLQGGSSHGMHGDSDSAVV